MSELFLTINNISNSYHSSSPIDVLNINEFINTYQYDIDRFYIDKFWNSINSNEWIIIDDDMLKWLGYDSSRDRDNKRKYTLLLERNFMINIDYKMINKGSMIKGDHIIARNCIIIQPKIFKETLMMLHTERAKQIRNYYLTLEQILIDYLKYTNQVVVHNQNIESDKLKQSIEQYKIQMDQLKTVQDDLLSLSIDTTPIELTEYVYILTSKRYYALNLFKIGKTINLKNRLSTYNTGNALADDEQFFLCSIKTSDSLGLEKQLHRLLKNFLHQKEWYRINSFDLLNLVNLVNKQQEATQIAINKIIETQSDDKPEISLLEFIGQTTVNLPEHTQYTMKDNKYFCNTCNKDYIKLGGITNHINNDGCKLRKISSFECPTCSKVFAVDHYYQKHIDANDCTKKIYTCESCNKIYSSQKCYETHIANGCIEQYTCSRCLYVAPDKSAYTKHLNRKIQCIEKEKHSVYRFLNQNKDGYLIQSIPDSIKQLNESYMEESDEFMNWFNSEYERTTSKDDILKLADVFQNYCNSDFYVNLTKKEKRANNKNKFIEKVSTNISLRIFYKEKYQPFINGKQLCLRNCLTNYQVRQDE